MPERTWIIQQKWILSDNLGSIIYFDTQEEAVLFLKQSQPKLPTCCDDHSDIFEFEEEVVTPAPRALKVDEDGNPKVRCSGCDFEISESSKDRYFTCDGADWVPIYNNIKHPEVRARWATAKKTVMCSECSFEINADRIHDYVPCKGGCWAPVTS